MKYNINKLYKILNTMQLYNNLAYINLYTVYNIIIQCEYIVQMFMVNVENQCNFNIKLKLSAKDKRLLSLLHRKLVERPRVRKEVL